MFYQLSIKVALICIIYIEGISTQSTEHDSYNEDQSISVVIPSPNEGSGDTQTDSSLMIAPDNLNIKTTSQSTNNLRSFVIISPEIR